MNKDDDVSRCVVVLPVIDLQQLNEEQCRASKVRAASEWGFFQVTNHGVPQALLDKLHEAQVALFRRPFERKVRQPLLHLSPESYRWGTPTATCLEHLSWSEAYHIPMTTSSLITPPAGDDKLTTRLVMIEEVSTAMWKLAQQLAGILVAADQLRDGIEDDDDSMVARCTRSTCFLRLNRYPACDAAAASGAYGLCPHTDSDVLTIVHLQDAVAGLQLLQVRGSRRWVAVEPNPGALMVNVGDLLQAWSNDRYRSVEHRVMASAARERFSVAFFLCPGDDTLIRPRSSSSSSRTRRYRSFTFGEYRNQVREDVRLTGRKLGLQRFRRLQQEQEQDLQ
ncbi:hypothetical protein HU200_034788 [Digitaria exilis]|uniref:Fe2OG dioxygenase domain-containing protein n=1 Tax=Digitaria exilis TaxID=1010633 RepID=A0A835BH66_9POAL|nr:hypothetical protein HU200_034788 [Digitaria exilis]